MNHTELRREIERAINRTSSESGSDTPDFILADYLMNCLKAFDQATNRREGWYGREAGNSGIPIAPPTTTPCPPQHEGIWWCNAHQREATGFRPNGTRCCDPNLASNLLPCSVVFAPMHAPIQTGSNEGSNG